MKKVKSMNNTKANTFYERKKAQLHRLRSKIKTGKEPMHDFESSIDELLKELSR